MTDDRIKYFDELGDLILRVDPQTSGPELGKLAENGLIILNKIVKLLDDAKDPEHGLQRVPDVEVLLEAMRDDYHISEEDFKRLMKNYCWFRYNSHAGSHSKMPDF